MSPAPACFLANVSHELRTPLNAILGTTHLMLSSEVSDPLREDITNIDRAARRLLMMINTTLDFSLVRAGELKLSSVPFNLEDLARSVTAPLRQRAAAKGIAFTFEVDETIPQLVLGDPHRISQVLDALVRNAVKFTTHGVVSVRLKWASQLAGKSTVSIEVSDTGVGIPGEKIKDLFSPFSQADSSSTRKFEGIGIGLALAGHLVELMGGKLSVESEVGKGSTFKIEIPVTEVPTSVATSPHSESTESKDNSQIELKSAELNVLLVEDNLVNQKLLERILKKSRSFSHSRK